jgi:hypothetical protein
MLLDPLDQRALSLALQYNDEDEDEYEFKETKDPKKQGYNNFMNDFNFNAQASQGRPLRGDPFQVLTNNYYMMNGNLGDKGPLIE